MAVFFLVCLQENLHAEIATKNSQIDESLINAQVNHMEMTQKLNALQAAFDEAKANWKLKETVESDSSFASSQENHNLHKESQTNEEGEVARERLGCVDQIENCRPLMNENEIQLRRKDDEHVAKIKQLVKEFSKMIALKEEEGRQALVKAIGKTNAMISALNMSIIPSFHFLPVFYELQQFNIL